MNKLTAKQLKWVDELQQDRRANEHTLRVAMTYHANMLNEIQKREREFWLEMEELYDLDPSKKYHVTYKEGAMVIEEKTEEDNDD